MNLKILRVMARMTQAEAAELVGVNQATISDWERGEYKPGAAAVSKLAEAYRVTEDEIIKGIETAMEIARREA